MNKNHEEILRDHAKSILVMCKENIGKFYDEVLIHRIQTELSIAFHLGELTATSKNMENYERSLTDAIERVKATEGRN